MLIPNNSVIQFPVVPGFHPVPVIRYRTKHIVELGLYNYILAELESYLVFSFAVKFSLWFPTPPASGRLCLFVSPVGLPSYLHCVAGQSL